MSNGKMPGMQSQPAIFEVHAIRRVHDDATATGWFSVVDIIQVLTQQADYQTARKYWNKLRERLGTYDHAKAQQVYQGTLVFIGDAQDLLARLEARNG